MNSSKLKRYFDDYIAASEIGISKSKAITKVIEDNNIERAIYVGDTEGDLRAANLARIPFVHAKYGFDKDLKSEYWIDSISELPNIITKIIYK